MNSLIKESLIILTALVLTTPAVTAQETKGKDNVLIDYFKHNKNIKDAHAAQLRNCVIQGIQETGRVELIDVSTIEALALEQQRRASGELDAAGDTERIKVMQQQGANALIQGEITSLVVNENVLKSDNSKYYTAVVAYTLKVVNPNTGKTIITEAFKHGDEFLNMQTSNSPEEAIVKVTQLAVRNMRPFVEKAFPLIGEVIDKGEVKKDEIKTVYISLGSIHGVSEDNKFEICIQREIAGRTANSVIGELEIESVEGEDISLGKVKKGGKELFKAMENKQKIIVKSKAKGKNIFGDVAI